VKSYRRGAWSAIASLREGFALVAALVAVVLIAVLVTGALFAGTQEARATRMEIADQQVAQYAERAALLRIAAWSCPACDSMRVGAVITTSSTADPPLESTVYVTRLDSALFLVVGEGRSVVSGGIHLSRRVSIAVETSRDSLGAVRASRLRGDAWAAAYKM